MPNDPKLSEIATTTLRNRSAAPKKHGAEHLAKHQFRKGAGKVPEGHHPKQTYGQEQAEHWGAKAAGNPPAGPVKPANLSKPSGGRGAPQRNNNLRMSGHSGAHCLGKRK